MTALEIEKRIEEMEEENILTNGDRLEIDTLIMNVNWYRPSNWIELLKRLNKLKNKCQE